MYCQSMVHSLRKQLTFCDVLLRARDVESASPILSLCNGVFTDQVIFSIILEHFVRENGSTILYACTSTVRQF